MQKAALKVKVECMERQAGSMLELALTLEGRLEEIESKVRVLQLVSVTIELLRDKSLPFLGVIAAALPKVLLSSQPCLKTTLSRGVGFRSAELFNKEKQRQASFLQNHRSPQDPQSCLGLIVRSFTWSLGPSS